MDVALCALSELLGDWHSLVEELLRALTRVYKSNHFSLMAEMCQLFLPEGKRLTLTSARVEDCGGFVLVYLSESTFFLRRFRFRSGL